ncbi:MAG: nuclear transport factor 2 family protein [Bryobacterales bacterium]|nr:nuclear transport factor 2 family protein [Bryobacterales bacterium]
MLAIPALPQERREVPEYRTYGEPATKSDAEAVDDLIRWYWQAWGRKDSAALMRLHAEDVEWINAYARMFQGAAPLSTFLRERLFPAFDASVSLEEEANMRMVSIRYLGTDAAVVHMYTDGRRVAPAERKHRRTHTHLVLEKRDGSWKVVHTAIMDAL